MPPQKRQSTVVSALILHRVLYGESDLILSMLTLELGKISALAKGARKSTRRFAGGIGVALAGIGRVCERNQGDLFLLESFDVKSARSGYVTDLAKSAHAAYALELCDRLSPLRQPEPKVYRWLEEFLDRLDQEPANAARVRIFELGLLIRLGLGPIFSQCMRCGVSDFGQKDVRFNAREGGIFCVRCAQTGVWLTERTRLTLGMLSERGMADSVELERDSNQACREVTLALLKEHLQSPLRSLEFIEKMSSGLSSSR
jgi:DNA repair protein RecO (recombination protein O)